MANGTFANVSQKVVISVKGNLTQVLLHSFTVCLPLCGIIYMSGL